MAGVDWRPLTGVRKYQSSVGQVSDFNPAQAGMTDECLFLSVIHLLSIYLVQHRLDSAHDPFRFFLVQRVGMG